ncbi:sulfatase [Coraliomargarita sp. SDUM461003]|uniref:Sulfatase n=1 Tax=Thalassobacterium maritimum TaxID=3041265 RepID=A0ABU1ATA4_9BACT|nr:sulfatase [Coraliomargarita sp. SDUM461003]MDQ8207390.1 sulfatase [Coraliomargarita sp. SDUM461003]
MKTCILRLLITAICVSAWGSTAAANKPNIIYLMADDQNFGSIGIYGNAEVQTPQMDKLGRDGVVFDRHYNTTSICMASRANVMTGMYEYKTGTNFEHGDMTPEIWAKSYPVLLREAGYLTAFAGKFGFEVEGYGYDCAEFFDVWGGGRGQTSYKTAANKSMAKYAKEYPHSTLSYGAFGQDVIKAAADHGKPFCLSISFKAPHKPEQPDPQFNDVYAGKTFTKPANFGRENGEHLSEQSKQGRQYPRFKDWGYADNYDKVMAIYYQQIYAIDVALGMIREELERQGLSDNTVIIYTSDNGFLCGAHGYGSKVLPLEESSRAPLMIYDPRSGSGHGKRSGALTGNIDFAPTILELAGLPVPENMDGVSLLPLLNEPGGDVRESLALMNLFGDQPTQSLTMVTKDWKYTYWWYGDKSMQPVEELFHLSKDPGEMTNLASNPEASQMLEAMRAKYDRQLGHWEDEGVSYNHYAQYTGIFDRSVPWHEKKLDRLIHGKEPIHWSDKQKGSEKRRKK